LLFTAYCLQAIFDLARGKDAGEKRVALREQLTPDSMEAGMTE